MWVLGNKYRPSCTYTNLMYDPSSLYTLIAFSASESIVTRYPSFTNLPMDSRLAITSLTIQISPLGRGRCFNPRHYEDFLWYCWSARATRGKFFVPEVLAHAVSLICPKRDDNFGILFWLVAHELILLAHQSISFAIRALILFMAIAWVLLPLRIDLRHPCHGTFFVELIEDWIWSVSLINILVLCIYWSNIKWRFLNFDQSTSRDIS